MPFKTPTLPELIKTAETDLSSTGGSLRRSDLVGITRVHSGAVYGLYGYLAYIAQQVLPDTCDQDVLERWSKLKKVPRKPASKGQYKVSLFGQKGAMVRSGTLLQSMTGEQYSVDTDTPISSDIDPQIIVISSTSTGEVSNLDVGTKLMLVSPVLGVQSEAVVETIESPGFDEESFEDWRQRILESFKIVPHGGNDADYTMWAREVAGVYQAWTRANYMGPGTVGVFIIGKDANDPLTQEFADSVKAHIDTVRPVTAEVFVVAAKPKYVTYKIRVRPDNATVRQSITESLKRLHEREITLGGTILKTHVAEAISTSPLEEDHDLIYPTANLTADKDELLVFGGVEWAT